MTLQDLCGRNVQVCIKANQIGGFVRGRLSQDHCTGGDYVVEGDSSRIIFHESTLDHINASDPGFILVFVG
jgi:hypothetical protein